ncbi:unnamed protein product [Symbiodinium sp. KB8]|nr:unnamed protein product [Symbiodinium sp. KB8]
MFHSGAMEKLLSLEPAQSKQLANEELANENGVVLGFRVKGRVTKLCKLPKDNKAMDINLDWLNLVLRSALSCTAVQSKQLANEELANENGEDLGFRVKGRVTKLWKLPKDNKEDINLDWLNLVLSSALSCTCPPKSPCRQCPRTQNRFENVLGQQ